MILTYPKQLRYSPEDGSDLPSRNRKIPLALFTAHIGRVGGSQTSEAKKRSSRLNGLKGGRPKQKGKR